MEHPKTVQNEEHQHHLPWLTELQFQKAKIGMGQNCSRIFYKGCH